MWTRFSEKFNEQTEFEILLDKLMKVSKIPIHQFFFHKKFTQISKFKFSIKTSFHSINKSKLEKQSWKWNKGTKVLIINFIAFIFNYKHCFLNFPFKYGVSFRWLPILDVNLLINILIIGRLAISPCVDDTLFQNKKKL